MSNPSIAHPLQTLALNLAKGAATLAPPLTYPDDLRFAELDDLARAMASILWQAEQATARIVPERRTLYEGLPYDHQIRLLNAAKCQIAELDVLLKGAALSRTLATVPSRIEGEHDLDLEPEEAERLVDAAEIALREYPSRLLNGWTEARR